MSIIIAINHKTSYNYDRLVTLNAQTIRLKPAPHTRASILSYTLSVTPKKHFINWQQDPFGNYLARVIVQEPCSHFSIEVDLVSEIHVYNPYDFFLEEGAEYFPFVYDSSLQKSLAPYLEVQDSSPAILKLVDQFEKRKKPALLDFLVEINRYVYESIGYVVRLEPGVQTPEYTLTSLTGSCRDMAWLLCNVFKHLNIASRFCSGYLVQLVSDVKAVDGPNGPTEDFTDLHAWCEVYIPGAGWIGLDPTSGLLTGEGHFPLSVSPLPEESAPVSGAVSACEATMDHSMQVTRLKEEKPLIKPYTKSVWNHMDEYGSRLEQDIVAQDIRLTVGGEPTFVSNEQRELTEWQVGADGVDKRSKAKKLMKALTQDTHRQGVFHFGQGKWYPGEALPRWQYRYFWRLDNELIFQKPEYSHFIDTPLEKAGVPKKFIELLAKFLGVTSQAILPAHEDEKYYSWQSEMQNEKQKEIDTEGDDCKNISVSSLEEQKIKQYSSGGLRDAVGFVLPLNYDINHNCWMTNLWTFKEKRLVLGVGNSPVGYRLPIGSFPYYKDFQSPVALALDPEEMKEPLPGYEQLLQYVNKRTSKQTQEHLDALPNGCIHTALSVEIRDSQLYVFLPPLSQAVHYLELLVAIECTAAELDMKVTLEGYPAPSDKRLSSFSITPDPGVLEVNLAPAHNWGALKQDITELYDIAHQVGLSPDKFLIDGRKVGTGGGNHIVLGAKTLSDSPFIRRPDVIQSMITFWQHHPSLSYLFSSLFIGPTSQAPRIDEARHDSLHELEIAFAQLSLTQEVLPWKVDRMLRNLLIDVSGNTHRTEICIDKLFSPDSPQGRLGLLEIRSFEMPPHPQLALAQYLLIKTLIAIFWREPYRKKLVRWGASLHDKFMMPHYLWEDFMSVIGYCQDSGYGLEPEWFSPFMAFRFPIIGTIEQPDFSLELRSALEPWPVLGESSELGYVSRGVDSSTERMQLHLRGKVPKNHILTVNGYVPPWQTIAGENEAVCSVRYKAWQPYACLHPTITPHVPIRIDLLDQKNEVSVAGCKYHVAHPGGRSYDVYPINDNEAEGRRLSRFESNTGTVRGAIRSVKGVVSTEYPCTLDLRLQEPIKV